jgi:large subunit ribosomal protein L29
MKRNDLRALRSMTMAELEQRARETKEELFNLRFSLRTGHLSDFSRVKLVRRSYAQIQTAISEKKIAVLRQAQDDTRAQGTRHGAA